MRYAELHCKSNFSFLEGASFPDELAERAAELGLSALAVTDRNTLAGVVKAHTAAKEHKLKLLIGAELHPTDAPPILLYATDRAAYARLSQLITVGRRRAEKGECSLTARDIAEHARGLIGIVARSASHRLAASPTFALNVIRPLCRGVGEPMARAPCDYRDAFPNGSLYVAAELHLGPDDAGQLSRVQQFAAELHAPLVAANDVHYHVTRRRFLQDVLVCVREGCAIFEAGARLFPNAERRLKAPAEMNAIFSAYAAILSEPYHALLERTVEIAERCTFSLDELRYEYPHELSPEGVAPIAYLTELTWRGARGFWPDGIPEKVRKQIEHELALIGELHYEAYFLTVWDLVKFARARNILCQGRGSAANSAVCYALGITSVDPSRSDVLFERFVSRERAEAPDIDVDFEHERREEVMQYVYEKYGRDRAGIVAEVICYRPKSAIRDVGKALGLSLDRIEQLAGALDRYDPGEKIQNRLGETGLDPHDRTTRQLLTLTRELLGFPRHLSQHVGGFVITRGPLSELVPIENARMPGRTVIEWDKDDIDALGILKVDCLALGMLTCIQRCFALITSNEDSPRRRGDAENSTEVKHEEEGSTETDGRGCATAGFIQQCALADGAGSPADTNRANTPPPLSPPSPSRSPRLRVSAVKKAVRALTDIPPEDPAVYEMCCRADTIGVFQIESRAQMSMLPRLKPRCFYDLVVEVSIVRPGPIQGGMVHPYLKRRAGEEQVTYPNDAIRGVLEKTLGVPLFQEQVMRLAMVAAGFTPGEADQLRRAMGAWRRPGLIDRLRKKLLEGMLAHGLPQAYAEQVFEQIRGFGEYGFPESHAASFALLVYASAWLKLYYPAEFLAAILNSQPMGFYAPAQLIRDAIAHGVEVRPVDVNFSDWDCTLEGENIVRLGLRMVRGLSEKREGARILEARTESSPRRRGDAENGTEIKEEEGSTETDGRRCATAGFIQQCALADRVSSPADTNRANTPPPTPSHPPRLRVSAVKNPFSSLPDLARRALEARTESSPRRRGDAENGTEIKEEEEGSTETDGRGCATAGFIQQCALANRAGSPVDTNRASVSPPTPSHPPRLRVSAVKNPFCSLPDLARRARLSKAVLSRLAAADAFGSLNLNRREALWQALAAEEELPLFSNLDVEEPAPALNPVQLREHIAEDYHATGLSLKAHPMSLLRAGLAAKRVAACADLSALNDGAFVRVAGVVLVRQRPETASGTVFMTLEDESGQANLICWPKVFERNRRVGRGASALIAEGRLQKQGIIIHVIVSRLLDIGELLPELEKQSRDFR